METIGKYLKRERELRNISLEEISTATKIRESLLAAIEEDRHDLLPTPVFVKGFLIAYGTYIGLDPGDVVLRYESDLKELQGYEEKVPRSKRRKGLNPRFLLGAILLIVGITLIFLNPWREHREQHHPTPAVVKETPAVQEEPPRVREETPPPPPVIPKREEAPRLVEGSTSDEGAIPAETSPGGGTAERREPSVGELTLQIKAVEETWIALQVDSDFPREMILRAGETLSQRANDHIKLKIGNAAGVHLTFNGELLGPLGDPGKIVRLSLTRSGYEFKTRDEFDVLGSGDEAKPADSR
jgi:cytoskeleton protein RodZ